MKNQSYKKVETDEEVDVLRCTNEQSQEPGEMDHEALDGQDSLLIHDKSSLRDKISYMVALSMPACAGFFLFSLSNFILMYFAGHLDNDESEGEGEGEGKGTVTFAGISLANMFINVTGFAFLTGMSTAVDTVASQQNGAKRYEDVGVTLLRSLLVLGVLTAPIAGCWLLADRLFLRLGVQPAVCAVLQAFLRARLCSLPADALNLSFSKYLMAMGVMEPAMHAALLNSAVLAAACWLSSARGGGAQGLAWAFVLASYVSTGALVWTSWGLKEVQRSLVPLLGPGGGARAVLDCQELRVFVALGVPGCAMICSEWWAYEVLTVFASRLGAVEVSAQSILLQLCVLAYMVPLGLSLTTSSMVGNALGADKPQLAVQLSRVSLGIMLALELCLIGPLVLVLGPTFAALFTEDPAVQQLARRTVHLVALLALGDGVQGVAGGVLRGAGKQLAGALANVFSYYLLGVPLAWLLCFRVGMGVGGLLLGISLAAVTQCVVLMGLIVFCEGWMFAPVEGGQQLQGEDKDNGEFGAVLEEEVDVEVPVLSSRELELVSRLEQLQQDFHLADD